MLVQTLSSGIVIHCSTAELQALGYAPVDLNRETALVLIERALSPSTEQLPAYPELQLFSTEHEVLIFVRSIIPESSSFTLHHGVSS